MKGRKRELDEIDRDIAEHIAAETQDNIDCGMNPEEAHYAALRKFGNVARVKEETRRVWTFAWLENLAQDLKYGARVLRKSPGLTTTVLVTLALGISANTAVFSVVNAVLLKPLSYKDPEQLVEVWRTYGNRWVGNVSAADLKDWQSQNTAFQGISAYASRRFSLQGKTQPQAVEAARVSPNFFAVMESQPASGRGFLPDEGNPGHEHLVVLGYGLWVSQFGSDPGILGRTIQLNDDAYTVVGIAPEGFHYPQRTQLWVPLAPVGPELRRDAHDFFAIGRLRPGIELSQARTQLNAISSRMAKVHPEDKELGAQMLPLKTVLVGSVRDGLLIAFVVVGFIFLIACANVATLLLSRAATRRREIAVRFAIGASRTRLLGQFFAEGLLLAGLAAAISLAASRWTVAALIAAGHDYFSLTDPLTMGTRVAGFTVAIAGLAALLISVTVGWSSTRLSLAETLKENTASLAGNRTRIRTQRALVTVQMACAFLLLVGTGALMASFVRLSRINTGFNAHHVLAIRLPISAKRYSAEHPLSLMLEPALARIQALPGVRAAGVITYLPMQSYGTTTDFLFTEHSPSGQEKPWAEVRAVSPDYYRALGIHLLRGRLITDSDSYDSPGVALVNETFMRRYSQGQDIVGRQIFTTDERRRITIVGVFEDVRQTDRNLPALPEMDIPYMQATWPFLTATMTLAVRTERDPLLLIKQVQQVIQKVDRTQAVYGVTTMEQIIADAEGDRRFALWVLLAFSVVALVLAAAGLFAQLSYAVAERTHEIGVRIALGARYRNIIEIVLRQGAVVAGAGMAVGLLTALAMLKVMRALLFGINPAQPSVILAAALALFAIMLLACYVPARRAAKVDPLGALRHE